MSGTKAATALASMEKALAAEARRFVQGRMSASPPLHAVPSMLAMLGCGPQGVNWGDPAVASAIVAKLRQKLRKERVKARAGHAGYDFNRHVALHQMLKHLATICPGV
jgi:hypothetical protein